MWIILRLKRGHGVHFVLGPSTCVHWGEWESRRGSQSRCSPSPRNLSSAFSGPVSFHLIFHSTVMAKSMGSYNGRHEDGRDHSKSCVTLVIILYVWAPKWDSIEPSSDGPHTSHTWLPHVSGSLDILEPPLMSGDDGNLRVFLILIEMCISPEQDVLGFLEMASLLHLL